MRVAGISTKPASRYAFNTYEAATKGFAESFMFALEDDNRRRLAQELRDTIAQNVVALIMDLVQAIDKYPTEVQADLSECLSLARQNVNDIIMFCHRLHPPMIDEFGLPSALRA